MLVQIDSICSILQIQFEIQFEIPIVLLLFLEMNWVAEQIENYTFIDLFCIRGDTIQYHGGLQSRELCQAPMLKDVSNS